MNNRTVFLVCVALALAGAYLTFFIDWHHGTEIQIFCEKSRRAILHRSETPNIMFHLKKPYPLTSIEVFDAEDASTNKYPRALWHVVASQGPVKVTSFGYGAVIRGMKPEIPSAQPEPLEPDTAYFLRVEAANHLKGEIAFQLPY